MTIQEIKTSFPKTTEAIREWGNQLFVKQYTSLLQNVPEEMKDQIEKSDIPKMTDEALEGFISFYPRRLYDFFDSKNILITIDANYGIVWDWTVADVKRDSGSTNSRIEAEEQAFIHSFKLLEAKL